MASKRIDELDARVVADADLLPVTPSGGPSGKATVAAIVAEGLSQPNSASAGAGASITIKAADGVTSGAGGSIVLQPGAQATTGGNGTVRIQNSGGEYSTLSSPVGDANNGSLEIIPGVTKAYGSLYLYARSNSANFISVTISADSSVTLSSSGVIKWADSAGVQLRRESVRIGRSTNTGGSLRSESAGILGVWNESAFTAGGSFSYKANTPAAIVANQNDYVLNHSAFQRLNCTTASDITGIAPPTGGAHVDGRMIRLVSVGTATVRLMHNDAASAAANRMFRHNATNVSLTVNEWADLVYDSTDNGSGAAGWRVVKYA
jgi:hypothetical protein